MKTHLGRLLGALTVATTALGCASSGDRPAELSVSHDPAADFSSYRTYDFTGEGNVEGMDAQHLDQMASAIEVALADKGFERSALDPDFLVQAVGAFAGRVEQEELKERYPSYFQREREHTFTRVDTIVTHWEEGTLALHVLDGESRDLVWSVAAEGAIQMSVNPDVMRERFEAGAARLLEDFPPR
jgi:hypothetical protein